MSTGQQGAGGHGPSPTGASRPARSPTLGGHPEDRHSPVVPSPRHHLGPGQPDEAQRHGCDRPVLSRVDRGHDQPVKRPGRPVDPGRRGPATAARGGLGPVLLAEGPHLVARPSPLEKVETASSTREPPGGRDGPRRVEPQRRTTHRLLEDRRSRRVLGHGIRGPRRRLGVAGPVGGDRAGSGGCRRSCRCPQKRPSWCCVVRGDQGRNQSRLGPGRRARQRRHRRSRRRRCR